MAEAPAYEGVALVVCEVGGQAGRERGAEALDVALARKVEKLKPDRYRASHDGKLQSGRRQQGMGHGQRLVRAECGSEFGDRPNDGAG